MIDAAIYQHWSILELDTDLTFEELLARILLKQSLMSDRCFEVADHEIEHRQDLFF